FVQPHLPFFEFPEPALDEGLALGVAVAAAAVLDPELAEPGAEARAVKAEPLSLPSTSSPGSMPCTAAACSTTAIASSARQRSSTLQPTISRVQQSMIAFRYVQPCSPTQTLVMSSCHSWLGRSTRKNPVLFLR